MLAWETSSDDIDVGQAGVYHHLLDVRTAIRLDRDVAVCTVEDATCCKTPTVVCHVLDCCQILAKEGHVSKAAATVKRTILDARHTVRYRH